MHFPYAKNASGKRPPLSLLGTTRLPASQRARVIARLEPAKLSECFIAWAQEVAELTVGEVVAIDGKTVRRSYDRQGKRGAIHMVSAWASQAGLSLGQVKTEEKSNEITAIPMLLELLELKGCIVTLDAMGCQTDIAANIVSQQADYVLAVKANCCGLQI